MTDTEPRDAVPTWPVRVEDQNHPFGAITIGAQLCAYCAAEACNSACPVRVETRTWDESNGIPFQRTEIVAGEQRALLAAGCWPERFRVINVSGMVLDVLAITTVAGTAVCKWHLLDELQKQRYRR